MEAKVEKQLGIRGRVERFVDRRRPTLRRNSEGLGDTDAAVLQKLDD
jgi:hypothetical protein